ncbi:hypothetical protein VPHD292_0068 [Vibrio phage D292]
MSRLTTLLNSPDNKCMNSVYVPRLWFSTGRCLQSSCKECPMLVASVKDIAICLD